jgi:hypothetical protein
VADYGRAGPAARPADDFLPSFQPRQKVDATFERRRIEVAAHGSLKYKRAGDFLVRAIG